MMSNILGQIIVYYTYINIMIFNLFKSKPTLKELIPNGFVDIHSHILPGIDDGAKNISESLLLISKMKKMGFSKIIGTPHTYPGLYNNSNESIKKSYDLVKKEINENIQVDYASEYLLDKSLVEKIKNNSILCLKNNFILIELPFIDMPLNTYEIIFEIRTNGYIPVLAHPERNRYIFNNFKEFYKLKNAGCMFQLNLFSLLGYYGKDILDISKKLLNQELIDFTASDVHNKKQIIMFENQILLKNCKKIKEVIEKTIKEFS